MYSIEYQEQLKQAFKSEGPAEFDGLEIQGFNFSSRAADVLPGAESYYCPKHQKSFERNGTFYNDVGTIGEDIHISDAAVKENRNFSYQVMKRKDGKPARKLTFLFHGFNEKSWEKYYSWGERICRETGSAVVFFPIAFHMQRAPALWSDPREMFRLSEIRKKRFPNVINSSLSNVAISMRLHSMPQRFVWSGLQTYYDIIQLIESYKAHKNPYIHPEFSFNIFAYSIGGFLAEILKLANHKDYFKDTKVLLFCGGSVFNRFLPVSKFILDSEADLALYSYLVEHFDSFMEKEYRLSHYIEDHSAGRVLHAMLNYMNMREFREDLFRDAADDFYAISMKQDKVIPPFEIRNTLTGAYGDIPIQMDMLDFEYAYSHENPFPLKRTDPVLVNQGFKEVFDRACSFLN